MEQAREQAADRILAAVQEHATHPGLFDLREAVVRALMDHDKETQKENDKLDAAIAKTKETIASVEEAIASGGTAAIATKVEHPRLIAPEDVAMLKTMYQLENIKEEGAIAMARTVAEGLIQKYQACGNHLLAKGLQKFCKSTVQLSKIKTGLFNDARGIIFRCLLDEGHVEEGPRDGYLSHGWRKHIGPTNDVASGKGSNGKDDEGKGGKGGKGKGKGGKGGKGGKNGGKNGGDEGNAVEESAE